MEFASFLAGERWSDHPECTDASLALLARGVNDCLGDPARGRLVQLIPRVVGLRGDETTLAIVVAITASSSAIGVASESRQHALAAGLLLLLEHIELRNDAERESWTNSIHAALTLAPGSSRWATRFRRSAPASSRRSNTMSACLTMIATAVSGISEACVADVDDRLVTVLRDAIVACEASVGRSESFEPTVERITRSTRAPMPA